ncbi:hypothetical protein V9T40_013560 [Parthenolecanium corni]|uniref:G-protein coupled receptors family 1 profile domain-containing protein n=1 Tax=Parthenolecanium corni TaxID=536013 RepID=A0AAN9Y1G6_9HEMI
MVLPAGYWPLGIVWCNVYVSCDVLACSCSIMHMCSISWGRYLGIRNPLKTRHAYATKRIVGIKIAVVWALSLVVSTSVTLLGLYDSKNIMPEPNNCVINNSTFFVLGSVVAFYIPMVIMMVTYVLTVQLLRKKARFLQQKPGNGHEPQMFRRLGGRFRKPPPSSESSSTQLPSADSTRTLPKRSLSTPHKWKTKITTRSLNKNAPPTISSSQPILIGPNARVGAASTNGAQRPSEIESVRMIGESQTEISTSRNSRIRTLRLPLNVTPSNLNLRFLPSRNKRQNVTTVTNAVRTEQKASKVLGLVFFSFVLCWTPFFLLNIVFAVCPRSHCRIPTYLVEGALWLGYASSIINPIIYTIFNRTFRAAFVRLLKCKCQRLSRPPRYRSVNENRNSALLAQTPSSAAAAGVATVPLSLSLQGTPLVTPSSASSYLTNVRTPIMQHSESFEIAESSTTP